MSRRRDDIAFGILVVATLFGCLAIVQIASEPHRSNYQAQYTEGAGTDQELAEKRRGIKNKRPAPDHSVCNQAQTEKEYEMCQAWRAASAAQEAADAAWLQIYISWLGLAGLLGTLILTGIAAKAAAKAARETARSVDVQMRVEKPLLVVRQMTTRIDPPEFQHIEFTVHNAGKTTAILTEWSARCKGANIIPKEPDYSIFIPLRGTVLRPDDSETLMAYIETDEEASAIAAADVPVFMWGHFRYEDVFGRTRKAGFCYRGLMNKLAGVHFWERRGGDTYNYDREESHRPSPSGLWRLRHNTAFVPSPDPPNDGQDAAADGHHGR